MMKPATPRPIAGDRRLQLIFAVVVMLHGSSLLLPSTKTELPEAPAGKRLTIRLTAETPSLHERAESPVAAAATARFDDELPSKNPVTPEPIETMPVIARAEKESGGSTRPEANESARAALAERILGSRYSELNSHELDRPPQHPRASYRFTEFSLPDRATPDSLIHPQTVPLPFADVPDFAVEFYAHGVIGDMQRFRDALTFSKTWTTKNGTRIGCALVLIIPACAWD